ncbi:phosphatase PAP2 family protein [Neobacillus vireti]|uniref:Membrane-associated phospholipid phosphatase n=1 Tax=Neobacillus vireti LMG 21834 TaxID=1131730 RepID=A0AB94IH05_9BACI|nr:phosphatase PAP2 family protein [Neobacillus vireti]ETI66393.1 membrane-associated phospholipid phosphatase [Neobacillus vireti LMG 21834]KLT19756.1 phosphoesterase PA-phosphatase [Neobacillus vireti]
MNLKGHLLIAFIISLACVLGFSLISLLISDHKINDFDSDIIAAVQGLESPTLTKVMKFFTFVGSTPVVIILCIFLIFFLYKVLHHRLELILFIFAILGSAVLNQILKQFFHRVRPNFHRLIEISGYSFPSGHAMNAFTVYVILSFLLWRHIPSRWGRSVLIILSVFMVMAIGISRIYLGVHYPSDIIGGYLASGFWLTVAIWFFQFYQEKRYNKKYKSEA